MGKPSKPQAKILLALLAGSALKSHRHLDGNKLFQLHPLAGPPETVQKRVVDALQGLISSNQKFPVATYSLTEQGREVAARLNEDAKKVMRSPNLELIDKFYNEMWNKFDKSVFPEILDEGIIFRGSLGQTKKGFTELGDYVDFIRAAFPDFYNEVIETITEGHKTFARLRYTGTHQGDLFGVKPTGKRIQYAGAAVFTIKNDKIAEVWVLGDIYGLLEQLKC